MKSETPLILILKNIPIKTRKSSLLKLLNKHGVAKIKKSSDDSVFTKKVYIEFNTEEELNKVYSTLQNINIFHRKLQVNKYFEKKYKNKLFVFNLPLITELKERENVLNELENLFKIYGKCEMIKTNKNYVFVNFIEIEEANSAIENLDGIFFHNFKIQVRFTHKHNKLNNNISN